MTNHSVFAQQNTGVNIGGSASIPGQGPNNIPLQGGVGEQPQFTQNMPQAAASTSGIKAADAIKILQQLSAASSAEAQKFTNTISNIMQNTQNSEYVEEFQKIYNALHFNNDANRQTMDLNTGKKIPTAQQLASNLVERIKNDMEQKKRTQSSDIKMTVRYAAESDKSADQKEKKKTRGNPFRVLMGQVGKLLDHGMQKRDIIKYLSRKGFWNKENIGKAVDIVKDYNRKKRKEATSSFNLFRYATTKREEELNLNPDWSKRSTIELFSRAEWLKSTQGFNNDEHNEGRKAADSTGVASKLKGIRDALKNRGFSEEELP